MPKCDQTSTAASSLFFAQKLKNYYGHTIGLSQPFSASPIFFFNHSCQYLKPIYNCFFFLFNNNKNTKKSGFVFVLCQLWCSSRLHNTIIKYDDDDENTNTTHSHCSCTTGLRPPCLPIPKPKQANTVHFVHPFSISSGLFKGT